VKYITESSVHEMPSHTLVSNGWSVLFVRSVRVAASVAVVISIPRNALTCFLVLGCIDSTLVISLFYQLCDPDGHTQPCQIVVQLCEIGFMKLLQNKHEMPQMVLPCVTKND